ncbi:MAG: tRNA (guanosine(46)-N7)-methyltransferase TrmB [Hyphomicrobiales bacterium]|nr:tRNA (guanosine(46)-N7)-methyltransferase TrmB [Hyphomicrobiales bacterium]
MSARPDEAPRHRLHGRRRGKALRSHHRGLMAEALPGLAVSPADCADPARLFSRPMRALALEVGFGGGEHLAARAQEDPDVGILGCEPFENGVAKLLAEVEAHDIDNVRVHVGDAGAIVDALPEASLSRADVFYPDPWPKRRQRKRRFVSDDMLARLARALAPGAPLRFATDIDDYAGWTLARVLRSRDFDWPAESPADWTAPYPGWPGTRYEAKALAAGRAPVYLTFVRRAAA